MDYNNDLKKKTNWVIGDICVSQWIQCDKIDEELQYFVLNAVANLNHDITVSQLNKMAWTWIKLLFESIEWQHGSWNQFKNIHYIQWWEGIKLNHIIQSFKQWIHRFYCILIFECKFVIKRQMIIKWVINRNALTQLFLFDWDINSNDYNKYIAFDIKIIEKCFVL